MKLKVNLSKIRLLSIIIKVNETFLECKKNLTNEILFVKHGHMYYTHTLKFIVIILSLCHRSLLR